MTKTIALAVTLLSLGLSAGAQIVIPPTTVTFTGSPYPYELSIIYGVTGGPGDYTYSYDLSTPAGVYLTSFTIGGTPDPINTIGAALQNLGGADAGLSGINSISIGFIWDHGSDITSADVSYTSPYAPTMATFTLNDDGTEWESPASIPAPVPEASTVFAGAIMILPLGVAVFRAIRKERNVRVLQRIQNRSSKIGF